MLSSDELASAYKDIPRLQLASDCRKSLWTLATEVLGFDKLTEAFHKPMLDRMDEMRRARRKYGLGRDSLWIWPREHFKTTCRKAQVIQDYLCDPTSTVTWWHAVEEMAQEVSEAVGEILLKNKTARSLFPGGVLPFAMSKRFLTASGFRLVSNNPQGAPSFRCWGQSSECTGGHSDYGYLDDVIARNTIENSEMPKVRRWYRSTVRNVVLAKGWLNASGTRWDEFDIYDDWIRSKNWIALVRHALEGPAGEMDYKGRPVLMTMHEIEKKREEMLGPDFAAQMMNDPSPSGEKPWDAASCEHMIGLSDVSPAAWKVVLSDPAPAKVGAFGAREGLDKDEWATVTVALQKRGQRSEIVLLDGAASKSWEPAAGWEEICRQKRRWETPNCAVEKAGMATSFYLADLRDISRQEGVRHREYDLTMTSKGKNIQFANLAEKARRGEFLIADSVPNEFLKEFLEQCRGWRPLPGGRNSLRHDDRANVVSFACDPVFRSYAPQVMNEEAPSFNPFKRPEAAPMRGARWVQWG